MQQNKVICFLGRQGVLYDAHAYIEQQAISKNVLNVGAAGGVENYLPGNEAIWLHARLGKMASKLVGVDIDRESMAYAKRHGYDITYTNCESAVMDEPFDLIVLSDVIEHMNAPGDAFINLVKSLSPGGKLIITTPNPTSFGNMLRILSGKGINSYYDHITSFLPENIQALCDRFGCRLGKAYFFTHLDRRTFLNRTKSLLTQFIGFLLPRTHASFLVEVYRAGEDVDHS